MTRRGRGEQKLVGRQPREGEIGTFGRDAMRLAVFQVQIKAANGEEGRGVEWSRV
mgnify:CR=1 FL=1